MISLDHRPNLLQRGVKRIVVWRPISAVLAPILHRLDRPVLERSGGRHSLTSLLTGLPVVVLTATGAKSGQPRSVPLLAIPDGPNFVLIASSFGRSQHPAWYHNVRAHPQVTLRVGQQEGRYLAQEVNGEERERLWRLATARYPGYDAYARRAYPRQIPVILLTPLPAEAPA